MTVQLKAIVANVTDSADKEFNNRVTPPEEPKFNQRNTLFLKRNSISLVLSSLMMILN